MKQLFSEVSLTLSLRTIFLKKSVFCEKTSDFVNFAVAFRHRRNVTEKVTKSEFFFKKTDFLKKIVCGERVNETSRNNFFIYISLSHVDINSFS